MGSITSPKEVDTVSIRTKPPHLSVDTTATVHAGAEQPQEKPRDTGESTETALGNEQTFLKRRTARISRTSRPSKALRVTIPNPNDMEAKPTVSKEDKSKQQRAPALLRRLWVFCKIHRPDLLPTLRQAICTFQQRGKPMKPDELVAAVMELLVKAWGAPTLEQVYRAVSVSAKSKTAKINHQVKVQVTRQPSPTECIDLTSDTDGKEKDETETSENISASSSPQETRVPRSPTSETKTSDGVTPRAAPRPKETGNSSIGATASLNALAEAAVMMAPKSPPPPSTITAATSTESSTPKASNTTVSKTLPPPPDVVQLAIAYGFAMGQRHLQRNISPSTALWRQAALSVVNMTPKDRERVWRHLIRETEALCK